MINNFSRRRYSHVFREAKNRLIDPASFRKDSEDFYSQKIADIYEKYQQNMKKNNALDFDDLLVLTTELLQKKEIREKWQNRFHYILIDEYQDTNHAQYLMARYIAGQQKNICAVGDVDQSIYSWRGADVSNIMEFKKDYPEAVIIKLEQNYRSTKTILSAANAVIENNVMSLQRNYGQPMKTVSISTVFRRRMSMMKLISL